MCDLITITATAKEILKKYRQNSAPIDVMKICREENINVCPTDLTDLEKRSERPISGIIYIDKEKNDKRILVNEDDTDPRKKFTIAHELGHYYLHIPNDDNGVIISFRGLKNQREREADLFAAELLMPKNLVENEYKQLPFPTASYLATIFKVSKIAMQYRLDEMGLSYIG